MTWNPRDLHWNAPADTPVVGVPPPSQHPPLPDAEVFAPSMPWILTNEAAADAWPLEVRREMIESGLIDDRMWQQLRCWYTRSIPAL